jgi:GNAT superfamily N-acetyltransferase
MEPDSKDPRSIFSEIGTVEWSNTLDAFVVETRFGARFLLYSFDEETIVYGVHIDEIEVPPDSRRKGSGTLAMTALCELADKYQFRLAGGPIGFPESPWRDKFVAWVLSFGFVADPEFEGMTDSPDVFYVHRAPKLR